MLNYGVSFEKFDESLQDMQIVKESLINMRLNPASFSFIKLELRKDRELTKMALEINPHLFRYIYFEFKSDLEMALLAIRKLPHNLQFMTAAFKKNPEIVIPALELDPLTLQYVDPAIENYQEIVMNCVKRDPSTFRFVKEQATFLPQILSIVPKCIRYIPRTERLKYLELTLRYDVSVSTCYEYYEVAPFFSKYPEILLYIHYIHEDYIGDDLFEFVCKRGDLIITHTTKLMNRERMLKIFQDYSISDLQTRPPIKR
ncbi:predicted protein [Naegleria gruberi]|uniref:Predicted protein n=1 Tax=Naegleria gruberi TaxID=5762 RepID=D2VVT6_NAEGR|nr:uncharacterized protein NAEGRDRAFT_73135 [Naegleria gruberi]EFC39163.1 predicted protein [Naegleria gruberi]|eukprot:XP_002671907.1 predicted protein [Naegleria gruberi strain NEG-M]